MNVHQLYEGLHAGGHRKSPEAPAVEFADREGPWYARALLGVMGWFGGMMVLGFFGIFIARLFDSAPGMAVLSLALFAAALALYRARLGGEFGSQFALAMSICAQALAAAALFKAAGAAADRSVAVAVALLQLALVWIMPNYLHRVLSTLFAVLALYAASHHRESANLVSLALASGFAVLAANEGRLVAAGRAALVRPVWAGLAFGVLSAGVLHLPFSRSVTLLPASPLSTLAFGLALLGWVAWRSSDAPRWRLPAVALSALLIGACWRAPGVIACVLVLLAAFASGRHAFTGLALSALLGYLSTYYYLLEYTLLQKAAALAAGGVVLLGAWWAHRLLVARRPS